MLLNQFDFTVQYVPGPSNHLADTMSLWVLLVGGGRDEPQKDWSVESFLEIQNIFEKEFVYRAVVRLTQVARDQKIQLEELDTKKWGLDLFAGTQSVANVIDENGFTVKTLDSETKYIADIRAKFFT